MLSNELEGAIARASAAARQHVEHDLPGYVRVEVLRGLGRLETDSGYWRRGKLALATAGFVLPLWRAAYPLDDQAERLLHATEGALLGSVDAETLYALRNGASKWMERHGSMLLHASNFGEDDSQIPFGNKEEQISPHSTLAELSAYLAYLAISAAAVPIVGIDLYERLEVTESEPSMLFDPGMEVECDAADAYAGKFEYASAQKRLEFWLWWLHQAVPEAWRSKPPPNWVRRFYPPSR